jgi:hypothetical protein
MAVELTHGLEPNVMGSLTSPDYIARWATSCICRTKGGRGGHRNEPCGRGQRQVRGPPSCVVSGQVPTNLFCAEKDNSLSGPMYQESGFEQYVC